ncbi:MAG: anthranilate phosphoribosyltransferase [Actinobacteria bacterium]|nr:anthranilate phosphoribosyltransferase [Actinomycetota bacterium]
MKHLLQQLINGEHLSENQAREAFELIMSGQASQAQIGALLAAMACRGYTVEEITGAAGVMREKVSRVKAPADVIDTCGTGGLSKGTFNISSAVALVAAGEGIPVAKHGNRSVTSKSGAAEVYAELGVNIEADLATVEKCIAEAKVGFCFAPLLHPAMKYAIGPRKEMGVRTIFNILGPLTNPAGARRQVMGVAYPELTEQLAQVLKRLGAIRVYVVYGLDGIDEISISGPTQVSELRDGEIKTFTIEPSELGITPGSMDELKVESPSESAQMIRDVLAGKKGPARDAVLVNAGAAFVVGSKAEQIKEAIPLAAESIDSGRAAKALEELVRISNERKAQSR